MDASVWVIAVIGIGIALVIAARSELRARRTRAASAPAPDEPGGRTVHEFMSPAWVAMAKREITAALSSRDLDVDPFTLSEEFTDPPPHLATGNRSIGFSIRIGDGEVEVRDGPAPDADVRIISDYDDALVVARDPDAASTDPAEAERRVAEGRLRIEGDPSQVPPVLVELDVHRLLAGRTA